MIERYRIVNLIERAARRECREGLNYPTVEIASEFAEEVAALALVAHDMGLCVQVNHPIVDANNLLECV